MRPEARTPRAVGVHPCRRGTHAADDPARVGTWFREDAEVLVRMQSCRFVMAAARLLMLQERTWGCSQERWATP
jgi:hypothetical protein